MSQGTSEQFMTFLSVCSFFLKIQPFPGSDGGFDSRLIHHSLCEAFISFSPFEAARIFSGPLNYALRWRDLPVVQGGQRNHPANSVHNLRQSRERKEP